MTDYLDNKTHTTKVRNYIKIMYMYNCHMVEETYVI